MSSFSPLLETMMFEPSSFSPVLDKVFVSNTSNTTVDPFSWQFLVGVHPVFQTLIFTFINALTTALGASLIFCTVCCSKLDTTHRNEDKENPNTVTKWVTKFVNLFYELSFKIGLFQQNQNKTASFSNDLFIPLSIGFGGGVMLAASFFSLLLPALNHFSNTEASKSHSLFAIGSSFFVGVLAILIFDAIIHKVQDVVERKISTRSGSQMENVRDQIQLEETPSMNENSTHVNNTENIESYNNLEEGGINEGETSLDENNTVSVRNIGENSATCNSCIEDPMTFHDKSQNNLRDSRHGVRRSWIIFVAMTLHNIPEGIIVGVAFAAASNSSTSGATLASAIGLSLGIAIQNITEGVAVTFPIYGNECRKIMKKKNYGIQWKLVAKSFFLGAISGITEPMGGLFGCLLVFASAAILPYSLAFASGVMVYVVIHELIPLMFVVPSRLVAKLSTLMFMVGFVAMMALDIGLA
ncbi:hypothetical protein C9374_007306 [Naegleria lovaniensis]|uniref:Zinc transporter ZIP11 n=1 Tax=Naegleria lovaniensis TaxID=51637 RepID=A0AA88KY82_NAELO|nr:uncharacterized protein C9374_007306 [Naegleria lovaniensis]KAG2393775.1 hypothetical protein C9374_007306 [Naegleria lovaniensis]